MPAMNVACGTCQLDVSRQMSVTSPWQFKHPTKPGRVTVAGKPSDDLAIWQQAL